ncbi:MAG: DDE-type integrase/transposase/recombinase [Nitrososphaeria archaeon]
MGDRYGRKPSHSSVLNWARALGSVGWTMPPRGRRLIAVDEAAEKVNGREVYVWAAMGVDTRELPAIKAAWSRSSLDALLFLSRVLGARTNKPVFVVEGGPWYSWALRELGLEYYHGTFGDRSRVERSFGSLKRRTRVFLKDINAGRSRIASLDRMMNIFFAYYNGPRFHKGIGRVPSEVIAVVG